MNIIRMTLDEVILSSEQLPVDVLHKLDYVMDWSAILEDNLAAMLMLAKVWGGCTT